MLYRCAGGVHQFSESRCALVNLRPAGAALVDMGTGWERTGDEMGVVSCCAGVAAERTEAPGGAPEGVKPRCCGQMDAKGNKVIKEEEAERRRQVKTDGWVGLVESGWCGTALAARAMWVVFFIFSISILESCLFIFSFSG